MFVDFEGIDGSGKTTLSNLVAQRLRQRGLRVTHAREGGELKAGIARRLRELTRDPQLLEMSARTEFLLNVARDAQQLEEVVKPALAGGEVCITDRYLYSQLAHSSGGRGLRAEALLPVMDLAAQGVWPDLVILVDVDPDLARLRKRLGKLGVDDGGRSSRKGLVGAGISVRVREAFLELARRDPDRWWVVHNDHLPLGALADTVCDALVARMQGRPLPRPPGPGAPAWPEATLPTLAEAFFAACDDVALREPALALYLLMGVPGLAAHQRRLWHLEAVPHVAARSLSGLDDRPSWELRELLWRQVPGDVAASLGLLGDARAYALRWDLFDHAPAEVLKSLAGLDDEEAWALRTRGLDAGRWEAVLWGLAGVGSGRAFEVREEALRRGLDSGVARSLREVGGEDAERMREVLFPGDRIQVLKSTAGLDSEQARRMREALFDKAPRAVLRSLIGVDAPYAWALREAGAPFTREALDSVDGMDQEQAWQLRERYAAQWPATALSSLEALAATPRGQALLSRVLGAHPRRLAVLRSAFRAVARAHLGRARTWTGPASSTAHANPELR